MVEETVTLIVIIVVGVLLGGAAFLAGWSDENRLFNPAFWFFGVPCGFIAAMMVPGGGWKLALVALAALM